MFPFTIQYKSNFKNPLSKSDIIKALSYLQSYTENLKGKDITISENSLQFKSGLFGWSWDKFAVIEKGVFVLTDTTFSFKFYMYRLFVIAAIMSVFFAYMSAKVFVGILFFIFLSGGNWVIALIKFRNMTNELAAKLSDL